MHQRLGSTVSTHVVEETLLTREMDVPGGKPRGGSPVERAVGARAARAGAEEPEVNQPIGHGCADTAHAAFAGTTITRRLTLTKGTISGLAGGTTIRPEGPTSSGPSVNGPATFIDSAQVAHVNYGGISQNTQSVTMALFQFAS